MISGLIEHLRGPSGPWSRQEFRKFEERLETKLGELGLLCDAEGRGAAAERRGYKGLVPGDTKMAEMVRDRAYEVITTARDWQLAGYHQRVRVLSEASYESIFPDTMRTFRHSAPAQHLIGALLGVNGMLYVLRKPNSGRARALETLLPTKERVHLRHRKEDPRGWAETIARIFNPASLFVRWARGSRTPQAKPCVRRYFCGGIPDGVTHLSISVRLVGS